MPGILRPDIPPEAWPVMAAIVVLYLACAGRCALDAVADPVRIS